MKLLIEILYMLAPFPWRQRERKRSGMLPGKSRPPRFLFYYYFFFYRKQKIPFQLALLLGFEKSWRESSIPREKSLESIQFRYSNARKREKTKICPHLFFFFLVSFEFFFFFLIFNLSRRVTSPPYTLPELTCLPFTFFSLDSVLIELNYTLSTSGRERGGGLHTHTHTSCNVFFFPSFLFWFAARSR